MDKRNLSHTDYDNYLKNELSDKERHAFEKKLMKDDFNVDALDGLELLPANEFENDITTLQNRLTTRLHKKSKKGWFYFTGIAASLLILLGIGYTLYINTSTSTPIEVVSLPTVKSNDYEFIDPISKTNKQDSITNIVAFEDTTESEELEFAKPIISKKNPPIKNKKAPQKSATTPILESSKVEKKSSITNNKEIELITPPESIQNISNKKAANKTQINTQAKKSPVIQNNNKAITHSVIESSKEVLEENTENKLTTVIKGTVSGSGLPLPGVTVTIQGKNTGGTITDFDGNYTINANKGDTLIFDYTGFTTLKTEIKTDTIDTELQADAVALNDVVVIGYDGSVKKKSYKPSKRRLQKSRRKQENSILIKATPFNGSLNNFKTWLKNQIDTSIFEKDRVYLFKLHFDISKKGAIKNIEFTNKWKSNIEKEIKNSLLSSPKWKPAKQDGVPIRKKVDLELKIQF